MPIYDLSGGAKSALPAAPSDNTVGTTSSAIGTAAGKGFSIFNTGLTILYFAIGATPTSTVNIAKLPPGAFYEDAFGAIGTINCLSSAAGGKASVTIYS